MNTLFSKIRDKHALWYKGIVFAFCILFCAYLLPKHTPSQTHQISVGQTWQNDDLIASFDFLVEKSSAELSKEKMEEEKFIGYYKKSPIDITSLISKLPHLSDATRNDLQTDLDSVYKTGYSVSIPNNFLDDTMMYLVDNNEVVLIPKAQAFNKTEIIAIISRYIKGSEEINTLINELPVNVVYDESLSHEMNKGDVSTKHLYKSKINKGEVLLRKNELITNQQFQKIISYNKELQEQEKEGTKGYVILGQLMACILILGIMMLFLAFFRKNIFSQNSQVTFIFLIIILIVLITHIVSSYNVNFIYAVPFCLVPILIRVFFDSRTSLFNFLNIILLCAFFSPDKFEFVFIQLIAGIGTIFSVADMGKRSKLFISAFLILVFYVLAFIAYHLITNTPLVISNLQNYIPFLISSVCVLFAFPLIFLFEKLFGFVSDFTLLELCDLNAPLLRNLSQKIPGTFQHSLQVANLAEEACYKIGGNALLVRTGAMYHDIGKMINPRFFTENQVGEVSPHEELSPEESAQIIIDHVIKGIEIARENGLPESVIDFIRTHHGTTTTRYFLHNYKKEHEGEIIDEDLFRYLGPIPFSKETAILMMADGVEASSRSLKKYDAIAIDELVDKIINHQINENQFMNADITFKDITQIKKIFKKRLMNIYHVRIEYPR